MNQNDVPAPVATPVPTTPKPFDREEFDREYKAQQMAVMQVIEKMPLKVRALKTHQGHDGIGFNMDLDLDGKKVAHIYDDANGGCYQWHWFDEDAEKRMIDAVREAVLSVTPYDEIPESRIDMLADLMVTREQLQRSIRRQLQRSIRRWSKKSCVFQTKDHKTGEYGQMNCLYSQKAHDYLRQKYGDRLVRVFDEKGVEVHS